MALFPGFFRLLFDMGSDSLRAETVKTLTLRIAAKTAIAKNKKAALLYVIFL